MKIPSFIKNLFGVEPGFGVNPEKDFGLIDINYAEPEIGMFIWYMQGDSYDTPQCGKLLGDPNGEECNMGFCRDSSGSTKISVSCTQVVTHWKPMTDAEISEYINPRSPKRQKKVWNRQEAFRHLA